MRAHRNQIFIVAKPLCYMDQLPSSEKTNMGFEPGRVLMVEGKCMSRCEQKVTEKQKREELFHGPVASIVVATSMTDYAESMENCRTSGVQDQWAMGSVLADGMLYSETRSGWKMVDVG